MQEFEFVDNRKVFRSLGVFVVVIAVLAALLIAFGHGRSSRIDGPDIRPPRMGILPPQDVPKLPLQGQPELPFRGQP